MSALATIGIGAGALMVAAVGYDYVALRTSLLKDAQGKPDESRFLTYWLATSAATGGLVGSMLEDSPFVGALIGTAAGYALARSGGLMLIGLQETALLDKLSSKPIPPAPKVAGYYPSRF